MRMMGRELRYISWMFCWRRWFEGTKSGDTIRTSSPSHDTGRLQTAERIGCCRRVPGYKKTPAEVSALSKEGSIRPRNTNSSSPLSSFTFNGSIFRTTPAFENLTSPRYFAWGGGYTSRQHDSSALRAHSPCAIRFRFQTSKRPRRMLWHFRYKYKFNPW
ncbi:hypothetical protein CPB84DRAFT_262033 [Gymnopilus junonius]|uniref:Uncharacterized protein n=1 Tax=Gymnopilus junonius TaxID=109634 RepID=A0A9P5NE38_GYMJU|nr:hypothetical protein CPB84DRAFT_262033 [Gymnopilus junonius]